ncbi:nickel ABC transporter substrate-binding protein [Aminipila butyrica]|uniref:Nickel ABC transporter substrate-binding protein n=1 Tax=Aminipila butyrica TaxID=433296 RepID=A0A858BVH5_9FIRM|nr:nickel ABC transporter substrate-binding protein [Aminipila butyrica]QIB68076.1 nickel ABC transporter substrate-binding protein [Aminipila butyrica]
MCHKNKMKKAACLLLILLLALGVTGCGNSSGEQENKDSKTVVVGVADLREIGMLDAMYGSGDILHQELIYEPLVVFGKGGDIQPGLAESWQISPDGKEYTFTLRQDVKFSDGSDFNADAVLFNVNRWKGASSTASLDVVNNLIKTDKLNDYTVKMTFSKSYYPYLTELSYPRPLRMMSPNSVDAKGEFIKPIGTGRWMVESYDKNKSVLIANPYYYGEKPQIEKIVVKLITDPQARLMAMESGEVDFLAAPISSENVAAIEKAKDLSILEADGTETYHFMFNYENPILQDINVRKAINYAIDKDSIVKNLLDGHGEIAKGLFSERNPYVTAENNLGYEFSTEKAKILLKEAGYEDSNGDGILDKNGTPLRLNLVFQSEEFPDWKPVCEYVSSELKKIGIDINLKLQETNAYYDSIWTTRDFDMIIYRTYADSWNPNGFLTSLYYPPTDGQSIAWSDSELNQLLEQVLASTDQTNRQQLYDQIFKRMYDEAMCVPLYYPQKLYVYNNRLSNLELAPTSYEILKWEKLQIK